jgi:GntR family transcriptional regulator
MDILSTNALPKYMQIAELLRKRIARGVWRTGDRFPTNEALMKEFDVSRITIREALGLLTNEKLIEALQGTGTFVRGLPVERNRWLSVETSLSELVETYRDTSPELLTLEENSSAPVLTEVDGKPAHSYFFMRRVHSRNGSPYSVISLYLDKRVFRQHPARFRKEPVIPILAKMKEPAIAKAHQTLTIGTAEADVARYLQIGLNAPVAEVRRVFTSEDRTVIYLAEVTYRADFIRLEMDLTPLSRKR